VTQIQIGCITECFGTTTTSASTAALAQQLLSDFNSLDSACGSSTTQPTPAGIESLVNQVACQAQAAQTAASQTEVASQSAATVQVSDGAPTVAQTQQGTWQLQIGCVFYCTDTQQVQQAQQSITIINVQSGASGSGPGAVDVTDQIIWQLQIGCVAWCYDATQVQVVSGQSTVILDESPTPPSPPPPAPSPPPTPAPDPPAPAEQTTPVAAQSAVTAPAPPAAGPVQAASPPPRRVRLFTAAAWAGASLSTLTFTAPAATVPQVGQTNTAVAPAMTWGTPTVAVHVSIATVSHPHVRRSPRVAATPQPKHLVRVAEAVAAGPRVPGHVPVVPLMLAVWAVLIALAAIWTQVRTTSER
jgi:hypothetical protein